MSGTHADGYHRLLVWDMMEQPWLTRTSQRAAALKVEGDSCRCT